MSLDSIDVVLFESFPVAQASWWFPALPFENAFIQPARKTLVAERLQRHAGAPSTVPFGAALDRTHRTSLLTTPLALIACTVLARISPLQRRSRPRRSSVAGIRHLLRTQLRAQRQITACSRVALCAFENEFGVQPPVGYWDPLGFTRDGDESAFKRRRETELKHGRVAMLACIGYMMPEFTRWPGDLSSSKGFAFVDIPNGLEALREVPSGGWAQVFVFCGCVEKAFFVHDSTRPPGDYKMAGVLGVPNASAMLRSAERNHKLHAEVANGRLAMMSIIGMFFQDGLTGSAWGDWANYTASPLRQTPQIQEMADSLDLSSLG